MIVTFSSRGALWTRARLSARDSPAQWERTTRSPERTTFTASSTEVSFCLYRSFQFITLAPHHFISYLLKAESNLKLIYIRQNLLISFIKPLK